jgi:hypothetical protein
VLDDLYAEGTTSVFWQVALQAVERFGIDIRQRHLDATSVSVEGTYAVSDAADSAENLRQSLPPKPSQHPPRFDCVEAIREITVPI